MACKHDECKRHDKDTTNEIEIEENMKESKLPKILYIISVVIFLASFIPIIPEVIRIGMYFVTIALAGYELLLNGIKDIFHLKFEEDTLMTIAVIAACFLGEFREACLVILLFCLGEFIEDIAISKSNNHIEKIVDMNVETANRYKDDKNVDGENVKNIDEKLEEQLDNLGELEIIAVEELKIGDKILIKPGEMIPVDCRVLSGSSQMDTSRLTGESEPKIIEVGEEVLSGNINLTGSIIAQVIREYKDSTASQIIDLVYEATNNKGKTEKFITKFSKVYTPTIMILALIIAVLPIILGSDSRTWITRALVFLVASCPCSIVISIPLAFFSCIGILSKKGLLIKGTKHIENFAKANTICFDKTGTITTGKMVIDEVKIYEEEKVLNILEINNNADNKKENINNTENNFKKQFFSYLYSLEHLSNHPIASSIENEIIKQGWNKEELLQNVSNEEEIPGHGIKGIINGKEVIFGNKKLLDSSKIDYPNNMTSSGVYLAIDKTLVGYIVLKEEVRSGLENLKQKLYKLGIKKVAILTGDEPTKAEKIAQKVGGVEVYSELLPKQKLEKVEELKNNGKVIFVGDGINDSPVLASADFSISMGEGTQIASNTADSILITNQISSIPNMIKTAKSTMTIIYFNMIFSLLTKLVVLILGIIGYAPIWLAVFADVGVTLITVLNSIRIYRK